MWTFNTAYKMPIALSMEHFHSKLLTIFEPIERKYFVHLAVSEFIDSICHLVKQFCSILGAVQ